MRVQAESVPADILAVISADHRHVVGHIGESSSGGVYRRAGIGIARRLRYLLRLAIAHIRILLCCCLLLKRKNQPKRENVESSLISGKKERGKGGKEPGPTFW